MKRNLLSIIVIALCVVNVVFSAVIVFALVPTAKKTNDLITQVSSIIDLELESPEADNPANLSVTDIENFTFEKQITVNLKSEAGDTKDHYALMNVTLSMNKKSVDFEEMRPVIETSESVILETVTNVFSNHTANEAKYDRETIKQEVLTQLRDYFKSDFIIGVSFGNVVVQ